MTHLYVIYVVILWLGCGIILAKEEITKVEDVYLKDSWAFLLISLVAPLIALVELTVGMFQRSTSIVLFKKKETDE